jgi:hypothetical protein
MSNYTSAPNGHLHEYREILHVMFTTSPLRWPAAGFFRNNLSYYALSLSLVISYVTHSG